MQGMSCASLSRISVMPMTSREGSGGIRKGRPPSTPWAKMMRHRAVWAIILNNFTFHYAFYVVMIWLPTYFDKASSQLLDSVKCRDTSIRIPGQLSHKKQLSRRISTNPLIILTQKREKEGGSGSLCSLR